MIKKFLQFFAKNYLEVPPKDPKIVCLGGGTGLSTLLKGLKQYTRAITAIVTMCDEGGSTGRLRRTLGVPAVGDIRKCLAALADDESTMTKLLQYRFAGDRYGKDPDLGGHNFGNLLLVALSDIMGDFNKGLEEATQILNISGQVIPSTSDDVRIWAETEDDQKVYGEEDIDLGRYNGSRTIKRLHLDPAGAKPFADALQAISQANLITCGPGDLYTSLMPNLLIGQIANLLKKVSIGRVFVLNIANKPFETPNYKASDYLSAIKTHLGFIPFTHILINSNTTPPIPTHLKYHYVTGDIPDQNQFNVKVINADLIDDKNPLYHDPQKLAHALSKMI